MGRQRRRPRKQRRRGSRRYTLARPPQEIEFPDAREPGKKRNEVPANVVPIRPQQSRKKSKKKAKQLKQMSRAESYQHLCAFLEELAACAVPRSVTSKGKAVNEKKYHDRPNGAGASRERYDVSEYGEFGTFSQPDKTEPASTEADADTGATPDSPFQADWTTAGAADPVVSTTAPDKPSQRELAALAIAAANTAMGDVDFTADGPGEEPILEPDVTIVVRSYKGKDNRDPRLPRDIRVVYEDHVWQEIMHYVRRADFEVSGWCRVVIESAPNKDRAKPDEVILRVIENLLPKQKGSASETDIDDVDLAVEDSLLEGHPGETRLWWHSHVRMSTFWSTTDIDNMIMHSAPGWILATVLNHNFDQRTALAVGNPFGFIIDELPVTVERRIPGALIAQWNRKFDQKVTAPIGNTSSYKGSSPYHDKRYDSEKNAWVDRQGYDYNKSGTAFKGPTGGDHTRVESSSPTPIAPGTPPKELTPQHAQLPVKSERLTSDAVIDFTVQRAIELGFTKEDAVDYAEIAEMLIDSEKFPLAIIKNVMVERMMDARGRIDRANRSEQGS